MEGALSSSSPSHSNSSLHPDPRLPTPPQQQKVIVLLPPPSTSPTSTPAPRVVPLPHTPTQMMSSSPNSKPLWVVSDNMEGGKTMKMLLPSSAESVSPSVPPPTASAAASSGSVACSASQVKVHQIMQRYKSIQPRLAPVRMPYPVRFSILPPLHEPMAPKCHPPPLPRLPALASDRPTTSPLLPVTSDPARFVYPVLSVAGQDGRVMYMPVFPLEQPEPTFASSDSGSGESESVLPDIVEVPECRAAAAIKTEPKQEPEQEKDPLALDDYIASDSKAEVMADVKVEVEEYAPPVFHRAGDTLIQIQMPLSAFAGGGGFCLPPPAAPALPPPPPAPPTGNSIGRGGDGEEEEDDGLEEEEEEDEDEEIDVEGDASVCSRAPSPRLNRLCGLRPEEYGDGASRPPPHPASRCRARTEREGEEEEERETCEAATDDPCSNSLSVSSQPLESSPEEKDTEIVDVGGSEDEEEEKERLPSSFSSSCKPTSRTLRTSRHSVLRRYVCRKYRRILPRLSLTRSITREEAGSEVSAPPPPQIIGSGEREEKEEEEGEEAKGAKKSSDSSLERIDSLRRNLRETIDADYHEIRVPPCAVARDRHDGGEEEEAAIPREAEHRQKKKKMKVEDRKRSEEDGDEVEELPRRVLRSRTRVLQHEKEKKAKLGRGGGGERQHVTGQGRVSAYNLRRKTRNLRMEDTSESDSSSEASNRNVVETWEQPSHAHRSVATPPTHTREKTAGPNDGAAPKTIPCLKVFPVQRIADEKIPEIDTRESHERDDSGVMDSVWPSELGQSVDSSSASIANGLLLPPPTALCLLRKYRKIMPKPPSPLGIGLPVGGESLSLLPAPPPTIVPAAESVACERSNKFTVISPGTGAATATTVTLQVSSTSSTSTGGGASGEPSLLPQGSNDSPPTPTLIKINVVQGAAGEQATQWNLDQTMAPWLKSDNLPGVTSTRPRIYQRSNREMKASWRPQRCDLCNQHFFSQFTFQSHLQRCHPEDLICHVCYHRAHTLEELSAHHASHFRSPAADDVLCSECGLPVTTQSRSACCRQRLHLLPGTSGHFMCEHCGDTFSRMDTLKRHLAKHSGDKPFQCEDCFASFVGRRDLTSHLQLHEPGQRFRCSTCPGRGVVFLCEGDLQRHLHIVHGLGGDGEQLPWPCPMDACGQAYAHRCQLHQHLRDVHGVIADGKRLERHTCSFCGKKFARLHHLVLHCSVSHRGAEGAAFFRAARAVPSRKGLLRTQLQRKRRLRRTKEEKKKQKKNEAEAVTNTLEEEEEEEQRAKGNRRLGKRRKMDEDERLHWRQQESQPRQQQQQQQQQQRQNSSGQESEVPAEEEEEPGRTVKEIGGAGGRRQRGRRIRSMRRKRRVSKGNGEGAILLDAACSEWTVH